MKTIMITSIVQYPLGVIIAALGLWVGKICRVGDQFQQKTGNLVNI